jgi:hypothetical protein
MTVPHATQKDLFVGSRSSSSAIIIATDSNSSLDIFHHDIAGDKFGMTKKFEGVE